LNGNFRSKTEVYNDHWLRCMFLRFLCLIEFVILFVCFVTLLKSQAVGISESSFAPEESAILDVRSSDKAEIGKSSNYELDTCGDFNINMGIFPLDIFEDCGTLYDSGGASSAYSDNESDVVSLVGNSGGNIRRLIVHNTVLNTGDTLRIESFLFSKIYTGIFFDIDTFYLPANEMINIYFTSDAGPSVGDGFEISWNTFESIPSETSQRSGFYCNAEKQSFGGGIQLNDEWGDGSGFRNINFGVFSNTDGESSIAIGTAAKSNALSIAMGEWSTAENQAVAIGFNATADLFGSVALGNSKALGSSSIAMGFGSWAESNNSISIGLNSRSKNIGGVTIGNNSINEGQESGIFGHNSNTTGYNSYVFGNNIAATCDDCIVLGSEGFGSPKVGVNKLSPTTDFEVGGDMKAEKLEIEDDFAEVAITSYNATLAPRLSLYKNASYDLVGTITSNLSNDLVISAPDGILNEGHTFISGNLSTSSLVGSGNRDVYVNSQGRLIEKPTETSHYTIPPYDFVSDDADSYPVEYGSGVTSVADNIFDETDELILYAPVQIPSGAEVLNVSFSYYSSLDELEIDFALKRRTLTGQSDVTICHIIGGPTSATTITCNDVDGNYNVIDNENYFYYIQIGDQGEELPTELSGAIYSARIEYDE